MYGKIKEYLQRELADIKAAGLYKTERVIASPQRAEIEVAGRISAPTTIWVFRTTNA